MRLCDCINFNQLYELCLYKGEQNAMGETKEESEREREIDRYS